MEAGRMEGEKASELERVNQERLELRRLRRKTAHLAETSLTQAIKALRRSRKWSEVAALLGLPIGTVQSWIYAPPRKSGRSVRQAIAALKALGEIL